MQTKLNQQQTSSSLRKHTRTYWTACSYTLLTTWPNDATLRKRIRLCVQLNSCVERRQTMWLPLSLPLALPFTHTHIHTHAPPVIANKHRVPLTACESEPSCSPNAVSLAPTRRLARAVNRLLLWPCDNIFDCNKWPRRVLVLALVFNSVSLESQLTSARQTK